MKYKQIKELLDLIGEYHWYGNDTNNLSLYVFVDHYNMSDFMRLFNGYPSLFDDEGIEMRWKGSYVCISDFDEVLGNVGLDIDEIKEIFDKEPWKQLVMKMWICRNLDDNLTLHNEEPVWYDKIECWSDIVYEFDRRLFPEVTFDNSPMEVELVIKK